MAIGVIRDLHRDDLKRVFEIRTGTNGKTELWRKARTDSMGRSFKASLVVNKPNTSSGYCMVGFEGEVYMYHRIVDTMVNGDLSGNQVIDHRDGGRVNNEEGNLSRVTQRGNMNNTTEQRENGHVPGSSFDPKVGLWRARVGTNKVGKNIYIGGFPTAEEAGKYYQIACGIVDKFDGELNPNSSKDRDTFRKMVLGDAYIKTKGCSLDKRYDKWKSEMFMTRYKQTVGLGYYDDPEDGSAAFRFAKEMEFMFDDGTFSHESQADRKKFRELVQAKVNSLKEAH